MEESHNVKLTLLAVSRVQFSARKNIDTGVSRHHHPYPELLHLLKLNSAPARHELPSSLQPSAIAILCVAANVIILGASHKENHAMLVLSCLVYFT